MAKTIPERKGPSALGVDAELARRLLHDMLLIRRFEEKAAEAYALGKVGGFLHLYIGEEAVAVGATSVLRADDYAISAYRDHGHCLAKGADPTRVLAAPVSGPRAVSSARRTESRRRRSTAWMSSRSARSSAGPSLGRGVTRRRP